MTATDVEPTAFGGDGFTADEIAAMRRHVSLVDELRQCRYYAEQERTLDVTM